MIDRALPVGWRGRGNGRVVSAFSIRTLTQAMPGGSRGELAPGNRRVCFVMRRAKGTIR
jgi:hypothetical protein